MLRYEGMKIIVITLDNLILYKSFTPQLYYQNPKFELFLVKLY